MRAVQRHFLPDRFRPRTTRRRSQHRYILPVVLATAVLLVLPLWKVDAVRIHGSEVVPATVTTSLEGLVGHLVPLLELEWLHRVAATWPAAAEVRVRLDLPGTLVIEIFPETPRGSVGIGSGWHGVATDGRMAGGIERPVAPRLVGFRNAADRRAAFAVARRLGDASGGEVIEIRKVTPLDFQVEIEFGTPDRSTTVHVTPDGTDAERRWCELAISQMATVVWADLRWAHRLVMREAA